MNTKRESDFVGPVEISDRDKAAMLAVIKCLFDHKAARQQPQTTNNCTAPLAESPIDTDGKQGL